MVRRWFAVLAYALVITQFSPVLSSPAWAPTVGAGEVQIFAASTADNSGSTLERAAPPESLLVSEGVRPDRDGSEVAAPLASVGERNSPPAEGPSSGPAPVLRQAFPTSAPVPIRPPNPPPALMVAPSPQSLLRTHRMVTYYGMAGKPTMGILGQLSPEDLVQSVKEQAAAVQAAGGKPVLPALHLVVAQAMKEPQRDGTYRQRVDSAIIQRYVDLAAAHGLQIILDHQIGGSSIPNEIAWLRPFLERPHVHLALDAEWAMPPGVMPGSRLGSLDANQINAAIQAVSHIVQEGGLPNKVVMVHQFRPSMITRREGIYQSAWVDFVINMDGYGGQAEKAKSYDRLLGNQSVAFASLQIFLRLDTPPFTPAQALSLLPAPDVIVYF